MIRAHAMHAPHQEGRAGSLFLCSGSKTLFNGLLRRALVRFGCRAGRAGHLPRARKWVTSLLSPDGTRASRHRETHPIMVAERVKWDPQKHRRQWDPQMHRPTCSHHIHTTRRHRRTTPRGAIRWALRRQRTPAQRTCHTWQAMDPQ